MIAYWSCDKHNQHRVGVVIPDCPKALDYGYWVEMQVIPKLQLSMMALGCECEFLYLDSNQLRMDNDIHMTTEMPV